MRLFAVGALVLALGSAQAQSLDTRTIELRHLTPSEAVKLLKPYIKATGWGVFDVSERIPVVTVRDTPENVAIMERVLAKFDRSPATIRLVFQLIEADTGHRLIAASNSVGAYLDTTLRSVLKFPTYRLLSQAVATAGEFTNVQQQLLGEADTSFDIHAEVGAIQASPGTAPSMITTVGSGSVYIDTLATGTVRLHVTLARRWPSETGKSRDIMSSGLSVPIGHIAVLGTASGLRPGGGAWILTVKPELVVAK